MPGFFDKVKESLDKGVTAASIRSKELLETQQVKSKLGALQDQRKAALEELGTTVYGMVGSGGLDEASLRERCEAIASLDAQIAEKEEALRQIHARAEEALGKPGVAAAPAGGGFCSGCGTQLAEGAKFCPGCGQKVG